MGMCGAWLTYVIINIALICPPGLVLCCFVCHRRRSLLRRRKQKTPVNKACSTAAEFSVVKTSRGWCVQQRVSAFALASLSSLPSTPTRDEAVNQHGSTPPLCDPCFTAGLCAHQLFPRHTPPPARYILDCPRGGNGVRRQT